MRAAHITELSGPDAVSVVEVPALRPWCRGRSSLTSTQQA